MATIHKLTWFGTLSNILLSSRGCLHTVEPELPSLAFPRTTMLMWEVSFELYWYVMITRQPGRKASNEAL